MSTRTKQLIKVGACGVACTALDVVILIVLVEVAGLPVGAAAFLAAASAAVLNFSVTKFWAMRDPEPFRIVQAVRYGLVSVATWTLVALSVHGLFVLGLPYLIAKAIAAVSVFLLWSYPAQVRFVFPKAAPSAG